MDVRDLVLAFQAIDTDGKLQLSQIKHVKRFSNIIKINISSSYYKVQISHIGTNVTDSFIINLIRSGKKTDRKLFRKFQTLNFTFRKQWYFEDGDARR